MFVLCAAAILGCNGIIENGSDRSPNGPGVPPGNAGEWPDDDGTIGPGLTEAPPVPTTRFARLTHLQWKNTVRDLLGIEDPTEFAANFRADPVQGGSMFDNNASALEVDQTLWDAYRRAASDVAAYVTGDTARLAAILPAAEGDEDARARAFIEELGPKVHRRPLEASEIDEYVAVYEAGKTLYAGVDAFTGGIRLVLDAFLQSPLFVYRVELSETPVGDAIPLDGYEIAQRLSYAIRNSMPDDELFASAATGALTHPDEIVAQARRMLDDPRADDVLSAFHRQLFRMEKYSDIFPSMAFFPEVSPSIGEYARRESELFVLKTIAEKNGTYADLLLSREAYLNEELARIYGVSGSFGEDFTPATLSATERRGLFTRVGFLGKNSTSVNPDPIHRGVFIGERVACVKISAPPDAVPPVPAPEGRTNRETVEEHTETPGTVCATCHKSIINPFGFPFENYDAVGQFRTQDNGFPVETSASPLVGTEPVPVRDAVEMMDVLAASPSVHECYARHWLEFAYGRSMATQDRAIVERIGARSLEGATVRDLIVGLVTAQAFLNRSLEELP